jgi:hypothetical protein
VKNAIRPFLALLVIALASVSGYSQYEYGSEGEEPDIYRNVLDLNPTSDGFYVGYERVLHYSPTALFSFDVRNTIKDGDDFGRAGFTWRYGLSDNRIISSRIETAWIDGQNNLTAKVGFDTPLFGISVTGVRSLSDPEITNTQETIVSSDSTSEDTLTDTSGGYEYYDRTTTTTNDVIVRESKFATPDGILLDINFNFLKQFHLSLGGSYWEVDDWNETGCHGNLSWQLTQSDAVGGHAAHVNGETEGGIYYRKSFSSLGDLFKPGEPLSGDEAANRPLLQRLSTVPYATPPIKIMTVSNYVEEREEVQVETETTEYRVRVNRPPQVSLFEVFGQPGMIEVFELQASDPDGRIVSYEIVSNIDGVIASGSWPSSWSIISPSASSGTHTISVRLRDNDGDVTTYTYPSGVVVI